MGNLAMNTPLFYRAWPLVYYVRALVLSKTKSSKCMLHMLHISNAVATNAPPQTRIIHITYIHEHTKMI